MVALDPRINAFRPDLAARPLQGQLEASHFVDGTRYEVVAAHTPVRRDSSHDARLVTEALLGEPVMVYETTVEGWAWGQLETDGYVGFLSANALARPGPAPTHKVRAIRTLGFPGPDIKSAPVEYFPIGARLAVVRQDERFAVTAGGVHIPTAHVAPIRSKEKDYVTVAERFAETPYLWGGKTGNGIDCSGLVQVALAAAGLACPRDSDMQELAIGKPVTLAGLKRGDLVFWKDHVAIARDGKTLIHANAHHMMVASEPAETTIARIKAAGSDVTSVRRAVN
jgi:hypothetical protein